MTTASCFKVPPPKARLWRYMDLGKLLALLESNSLFLASVASFDDPFEGHSPRLTIMIERAMPFGLSEEEYTRLEAEIDQSLTTYRTSRERLCASCWHLNEVESAAMWGLYLKSDEGIAIATTYERLMDSLGAATSSVQPAMVQYVDFDTFHPGRLAPHMWGTYKRSSFSHERELRLLAEMPRGSPGISIPVHLPTLVQSISLAPTTPQWLVSAVTSLVKRYSLSISVERSRLLDPPTYYGNA